MKGSWTACGWVAVLVLVVGASFGVTVYLYLSGPLDEGQKAVEKQNTTSEIEHSKSILVGMTVLDAQKAIADDDPAGLTKAAEKLEKLGDWAIKGAADLAANGYSGREKKERLAALALLGELGQKAKTASPVLDAITKSQTESIEIKKAAEAALAKIKGREPSP